MRVVGVPGAPQLCREEEKQAKETEHEKVGGKPRERDVMEGQRGRRNFRREEELYYVEYLENSLDFGFKSFLCFRTSTLVL